MTLYESIQDIQKCLVKEKIKLEEIIEHCISDRILADLNYTLDYLNEALSALDNIPMEEK